MLVKTLVICVVRCNSSAAGRLVCLSSIRQRSSYYGETKRSFIPRFVRSYVYRHPMSPYAVIFGVLLFIFTQPYWHMVYAYCKLDFEDYRDYREYANRIALARARHGTNLFIPIIDKDPRFDRFSYFLERTNKRRAGLLVTPVPEDDDDLKGEPFFDFLKKAKEEGK